jgi:pyruvate/2-oxoglutarate dehydrogenase complex dihydrolipoamide acyltransferase (E2) component
MADRAALTVMDAVPSPAALVVPDLGIDDVRLSLWLVPAGAAVIEGDRVAELVSRGVTVDLEAPVTGRLVTWLVDEDQTVDVGDTLALFEAD